MTYEHILRMPGVGGQEIPREKVNILPALAALNNLYPQEILHMSIFGPTAKATGAIEMADVSFKVPSERML